MGRRVLEEIVEIDGLVLWAYYPVILVPEVCLECTRAKAPN